LYGKGPQKHSDNLISLKLIQSILRSIGKKKGSKLWR
jgi:hypothetical protein